VALVYGSQHKSLAALELLVHRDPTRPNRFTAFFFQFPEALVETVALRTVPQDWRQEPPPPSTQQVGDAWMKESRSAVLAVPSIIIPEELNYILNPAHPDFRKITIGKPQNFAFDARLLT
jgi:RES domain-containing protein